jgi:hypothetical protein
MAEIINLRQAKKRRARDGKAAAAETNRARFGRTKGARKKTEAEEAKAKHDLDGKKLD